LTAAGAARGFHARLPSAGSATQVGSMRQRAVPSFAELEEIPGEVARALGELLARLDRARYMRFLDAMYHYTRGSGAKIRQVHDSSDAEDVRGVFGELESEETEHYRLAEADLEALGGRVSSAAPPAVVAFDRTWRGLSAHGYCAYLGAAYVFENIARHLQQPVREALGRLALDRSQTRWVRVHMGADLEHGAAVAAVCRRHFEHGPGAMLAGARSAADAWLGVFAEALR
jgi:hypothetical protein